MNSNEIRRAARIVADSFRRDVFRTLFYIRAWLHSLFFVREIVGRYESPFYRLRRGVRRTILVIILIPSAGFGWVRAAERAELREVQKQEEARNLAVATRMEAFLAQEQAEQREIEENKRALLAERDSILSGYARRYGIKKNLAAQIWDIAAAEGLDPEIAFRLVRVESRFEVGARSPVGALGLTQLMPGTARFLNPRLSSTAAILEPENNLRTGFKYLKQMIRYYDGNLRLALLAYNRGPVAVDAALEEGREPSNGYEKLVMGPKAAGRGGATYKGSGLMLEQPQAAE